MPKDLSDDKSIMVQVMAWCHQATSHYLSQCWCWSMTPYSMVSKNREHRKRLGEWKIIIIIFFSFDHSFNSCIDVTFFFYSACKSLLEILLWKRSRMILNYTFWRIIIFQRTKWSNRCAWRTDFCFFKTTCPMASLGQNKLTHVSPSTNMANTSQNPKG